MCSAVSSLAAYPGGSRAMRHPSRLPRPLREEQQVDELQPVVVHQPEEAALDVSVEHPIEEPQRPLVG